MFLEDHRSTLWIFDQISVGQSSEAINDAHKNGVTALALSSDCGRIAPRMKTMKLAKGLGAMGFLSLKLTFSHLKMDGWKMSFLLG